MNAKQILGLCTNVLEQLFAELRLNGFLRSSGAHGGSHRASVDGIMLQVADPIVPSEEDDAYAQRRARQGGGRRAPSPDLPGNPDLRPAVGQEVPDALFATPDGARPRMAAARRRAVAPGLVRVGHA